MSYKYRNRKEVIVNEFDGALQETFNYFRSNEDGFEFKSVEDFVEAYSEDELIEMVELDPATVEELFCV